MVSSSLPPAGPLETLSFAPPAHPARASEGAAPGVAALPPAAAPGGTVTFLFTDIEGSTRRWETRAAAMPAALARHDDVLRAAIAQNGGYVIKTVGDAFYAAFATAPDALATAVDAQFALHDEAWGDTGELRVRMALHTGTAEQRDGDYFGPALNRVARLLAAGHGGQVLLTEAAGTLVRDHLLDTMSLRDLGTHRLKDLTRPERVFQLVAPPLPTSFPPLRTLNSHPNNLPPQVTPLVGREREVEAVARRLDQPEVRLLTLTGPGGTGKTRLALQVAAETLESYEDGVYFVPLAPVAGADLVPPAVARALGIGEAPEQPVAGSLVDYLREKHLLLVLDNFEHVLPAAALVSDLLAAAPRLKVLATSRAVLHLAAEREFAVPPLALPDLGHLPPLDRLTQYEAVRLFIERAQAVKPDFQVTNENAPAVAEICHRLDGLPLAIELAAARVRALSPQAILARLERRLPLLTGGARDLPARQQTLRNAIAWGYDLLSPAEQTLFRRLAAFAGGCTLDAAEAVAGSGLGVQGAAVAKPDGALATPASELLDGLDSLVSQSLLREQDQGGEPRFLMLETIREFGLEQLAASGEAETVQRRHADYYLQFAETAELKLTGTEQGVWLARLERDHQNLLAALAWFRDQAVRVPGAAAADAGERALLADVGGDSVREQGTAAADAGERALRLVGAAFWLWNLHGHWKLGQGWLETALALPAAQAHTAARAKALSIAGMVTAMRGDAAAARARLEESIRIADELGDAQARATAAGRLGLAALWEDDTVAAQTLFGESLRFFVARGDDWGQALAHAGLGNVALRNGDRALARSHYRQAFDHRRQIGDKWGIGHARLSLAEVDRLEGRFDASYTHLQESLRLFRDLDSTGNIAMTLTEMARLAEAEGQGVRAARLLGAAATLYESLGARLPEDQDHTDCFAALHTLAGEDAIAAAFLEGRAMPAEAAVAYALAGRGA